MVRIRGICTVNRKAQIAETRRLIEEGLTRVALAEGYSSVAVSDITDEGGVSRTTFYRHFDTKRDVLVSLFRRISAEFRSEQGAEHDLALQQMLERRFSTIRRNTVGRIARIPCRSPPTNHAIVVKC